MYSVFGTAEVLFLKCNKRNRKNERKNVTKVSLNKWNCFNSNYFALKNLIGFLSKYITKPDFESLSFTLA